MQSVVNTIIGASNRIVEDNKIFNNIYKALIEKGQKPEEYNRAHYDYYIKRLNKGGKFQSKTVKPSNNNVTIKADGNYLALETVVVEGDKNLLPENIRSGVTIFGVTGTYTGS